MPRGQPTRQPPPPPPPSLPHAPDPPPQPPQQPTEPGLVGLLQTVNLLVTEVAQLRQEVRANQEAPQGVAPLPPPPPPQPAPPMVGNPGPYDDNAVLKDFKSWGPPSYDGTPDPARAEKWLKDIEKIFDLLRCTDELKVRMATYMLVDDAWDWWKSTSKGIGPITWDEFQNLFLDRYFSMAVKERKYYEFMGLRQGNMTVDQYVARFTNLSRFAPTIVNKEANKIRKFRDGLNPQLCEKLLAFEFHSFNEVIRKVQMLERGCEMLQRRQEMATQKRRANQFQQQNQFGGDKRQRVQGESSQGQRQQPQQPKAAPQDRAPQQPNRPLGNQGQQQPRPQQQQPRDDGRVQCWDCGERGHVK